MENRETRFAKHWERMFGVRVKDLRTARGWTQDDLASRMTTAGYPMHQTTVAKMESGSRPTNVGEVAALAAIFGITIGSVFSDVIPADDKVSAMARLFDRWESARQEALRAKDVADEAFKALSRFVQENHDDTLTAFYERVQGWADFEVDAGTDAEARAVAATVLRVAIPVKPFVDLEDEAYRVLQEEREGKADGEHPEAE